MQYIRIRNLREDMDMTQTDMAKNLFISQRTYSYYEFVNHETTTDKKTAFPEPLKMRFA